MPVVIPFDQAMKKCEGKTPSLLVGNGFSRKHFSYNTLLEKCGLHAASPLRALFAELKTVDFEVIIRALEDAATVESVYHKARRATLLSSEADKLRRVLVHAIREIHPPYRDNIQSAIPSCAKFLSQFGTIFTLNYDLLLYWVILETPKQFGDGFGLAEPVDGFRRPFKEQARCNVYNLHGGLHLFRTSNDEIEKRVKDGDGIVEAIGETITKAKRLPLYVAEGSSPAKTARIYAMPYLRHCYEKLRASTGPFFVYGHSASTNDAHIYEALFNAKIDHLFFCIHQPTASLNEVAGELARYKERNNSTVDYSFVDSTTAPVWP